MDDIKRFEGKHMLNPPYDKVLKFKVYHGKFQTYISVESKKKNELLYTHHPN